MCELKQLLLKDIINFTISRSFIDFQKVRLIMKLSVYLDKQAVKINPCFVTL